MSLYKTLLFMGYTDEDFAVHGRADGNDVVEWFIQNQPTEQEIAAAEPLAQAAWEAEQAAKDAAEADKAELREQFQAAHARLVQIRDGTNPTNAQVVAGMKDIAGYQIKILRALYGMLTD